MRRWRRTDGTSAGIVPAITLALVIAVAATVVVAASPRATQAPPDRAAPAGPLDTATLTRAAADLPQLHSLVVDWRGQRLFEYYARGRGADRLANIKSASKSLITALVGIALDRGLIKDLRTPVATFFPELSRARDADVRGRITLEDLLTMRSGLESTSGRNYGAWVRSRNWVSHALQRPMVSEPGTSMEYSTGTSHVLSALLTKATGRSTWQFAQEALARPLGFSLAQWPRDAQGIYFGGNEMLLTPRQMASVGALWLARGRVGDRQVVPAAWVDTSCVPRTRSRYDSDREYGYGWWIQTFAGETACFAWGYGGQYIMVFRDLSLVVVATAATTVSEERRDHRRRFFALLDTHVVAPVAERERGARTGGQP